MIHAIYVLIGFLFGVGTTILVLAIFMSDGGER